MDNQRIVNSVLNSFIGGRDRGGKTTKFEISENHKIGDFENEREEDEKRRVWLMLSDKDKMFCKREARELKRRGLIKGTSYSDYIEYLIKQEEKENG